MSPIAAIVTTISPPPPSPWSARKTISSVHVLAQAAQRRADEEDHDRRLQDDLPAVEVAELAVQRPDDGRREQVAVTTHDRCSIPPRSPTIVGSAVETIVWSSDASSRTSISAAKIRPTRGACWAGGFGSVAELTAASSTVTERIRARRAPAVRHGPKSPKGEGCTGGVSRRVCDGPVPPRPTAGRVGPARSRLAAPRAATRPRPSP